MNPSHPAAASPARNRAMALVQNDRRDRAIQASGECNALNDNTGSAVTYTLWLRGTRNTRSAPMLQTRPLLPMLAALLSLLVLGGGCDCPVPLSPAPSTRWKRQGRGLPAMSTNFHVNRTCRCRG